MNARATGRCESWRYSAAAGTQAFKLPFFLQKRA